MRRAWFLLDRVSRGLEVATVFVGGGAAVAMMLLVTLDVIARALTRSGFEFTTQVASTLLLPAVAFLPVAFVARANGHVRVPFVFDRLPLKAQRWVEAVTSLLTLIFWVVLARAAWGRAIDAIDRNLVPTTDFPLPLYYGLGIFSVAATVMVLRSLMYTTGLILATAQPPTPRDESAEMKDVSWTVIDERRGGN